jgi:putative transposase
MTVKAYKFRLYPTKEQEILLNKHFGCARFVYNWALEYKTKYYKEHKKNIHWMKLAGKDGGYINFKREHPWLKEVNSQSLVGVMGNLDNAYKNFFEGRAKFPKFKKKSNKQTFQVTQHGKIDVKNGKLFIPKFMRDGGIKCVVHRPIAEGKHGTYTIEKRPSGRFFVSILVHTEEPIKEKPSMVNAVGLDFGLKTFITTSDGESIKSPEYFKSSLKRLARLQRKLSKAQKNSKNKDKARLKVAKLYEKISNQRQDYLHKLSHKLVCESQTDTICIEDLNLSGMQKLWGRKTNDLSWGEFTRQLQYKCDWYGKNLIKIGRFDPSSKMCSKCGHIHNLDLGIRKWTCTNCKSEHDRDINAARNIKDFGMNQYQLSRVPTDVKPLEKKALARNRKKSGETVFNEEGKKQSIRKYTLKPS